MCVCIHADGITGAFSSLEGAKSGSASATVTMMG